MSTLLEHILRWGGLLVFLSLTLSPFYALRFDRFKPTRWYHAVGAYLGSFVVLTVFLYVFDWLEKLNPILKIFSDLVIFPGPFVVLLILWPGMVFYCSKQIYGKLDKEIKQRSSRIAALLFAIVVILIFIGIQFTFGAIFNQIHS